MKKIFSLLLAGTIILACAVCQPNLASALASSVPSVNVPAEDASSGRPTQDIAILYTSDVHCAIDGEIGYAGVAAYKRKLQGENMEVLLVDCGDSIQGEPIGAFTKGEDILSLMNFLGYDVAIPGNHEFDYGMEQFKKLVGQAKFPYLSVNFVDETTGAPILSPYTIKEVAGVKIAFVGATTPLTITASTPAYFQNDAGEFIYGFLGNSDGSKLYAAVQKAVDDARSEGADYVIALTHLGIGEAATPYLSPKLIENTNGIDAVLDGHSHLEVECERVRNKDGKRVLLSQPATRLSAIGMLMIDRTGNLSTGLIRNISEKCPEMSSAVAAVKAKFDEMLGQKVGAIQTLLTVSDPVTGARIIRNAETNLGNLCADAYLAAGKTEVAFVNGGGIRADLVAGDITYGDILKVFPYGNSLCTVEATGQNLLDALEHSVRMMPEETGGFLQVAGVTFEVDPTIPSPVNVDENGMFQKIYGVRRVKNVVIGGAPVDPAHIYTLTSHSYLIKNGGDGYNMFADNKLLQDEFVLDYTALIDYLTNKYPARAAAYAEPYGEGRIVAAEQK